MFGGNQRNPRLSACHEEKRRGTLRQSLWPSLLKGTLHRDSETGDAPCLPASLLHDSSSRSSGPVARVRRTVVDGSSGRRRVRETRLHQETPRRLYELPSSFS